MKQKSAYFNDNFLTERILQHSTDLISLHTRSGEIVYITPSTSILLGYKPEEIVGKSLKNFLHPEDYETISVHDTDYYVHKYVSCRIRRKEGDYIWIETMVQPMHDIADGENDLFLCISRDITARKIAENKLNESIERYRRLVENSHDTIGIISNEGTFSYINETGKKLFGVTSTSEIIGKTIYDFTPKKDHSKIKEFIMHNGNSKTSDFLETSLIRFDNEVRLVNMKLISMNDNSHQEKQMIIRDITEQKLTEERLQQAEKLSVVGHLAAGIAHEIRNPLTAIKGFVQLLQEKQHNGYIDVIITELERIDKIIGDLLILAKPQIRQFNKTNINELIENLISLFKSQAVMNNVELFVNFNDKDIVIECEQDKIKQVFLNIIKNSFEAIEKKGKISITCEQVIDQEKVEIIIQDNGVGIPSERLPKLGEPFYSTKEKGTGLGLMICNKIVKEHNGSLHISSKENEGTVVKVTLPLYQTDNELPFSCKEWNAPYHFMKPCKFYSEQPSKTR